MIGGLLIRGIPIGLLFGGGLVLIMGVGLLVRREKEAQADMAQSKDRAAWFFSFFIVGITNPAAILTYIRNDKYDFGGI